MKLSVPCRGTIGGDWLAKTRIYQAAKELSISNTEILGILESLGVEAKSHMSSIDEETVAKVKELLDSRQAESKPKAAAVKASKPEPKQSVPEPVAAVSTQIMETTEEEKPETEALPILEVPENATVSELAALVDKPPNQLIKSLIAMGEMLTINQPMSVEAVQLLTEELGFEVKIVAEKAEEIEEEIEAEGSLAPRPPVVTIMGHVDHGKTSLLDAIRKTNVIAEEQGGITQHIGAYQVVHNDKKITFIDTPGHEAFTAMRARGAQVTDVAVLVVAADDGVMPQTVEAIDHAKAAGVPIVVAINKIDKPEANPDRVKKDLSNYGLLPEEWGGDTVYVNISAKQKVNIEELLELILIVSEILELKANPNRNALGFTIEARLDKGRGPVATILVEKGTLRVGDAVVVGTANGKVRAMLDDKGRKVKEAAPAMPVEVLGLSEVPQAGDIFRAVDSEKEAKQIGEERALKRRIKEHEQRPHVTLDDLFERIKGGEIQDLNLIVKGDVQGSIEALCESLNKLDQTEVRVNIIHRGVGAITESDVMLAAASNAIIIGFNVRPQPKAKEMAAQESVDLRTYRVIYKVVEDINAARVGMLKPEFEEVELGQIEVLQTFKVPKIGLVAGSIMRQGQVKRNNLVRVVRDGIVLHEGGISSLRRFKEDVTLVKEGFEFGIGLQGFSDLKVGDILEVYEIREKART